MSTRTDSLLKQILRTQCKIEELLGNPVAPTSNNDVEVTCISNDGGTTSVSGVVVYDLTVSPPTETIYLNGVNVTGTYIKVPCNSNTTLLDYEKKTVCVDGLTYTKVFVFDATNDGSPNLITVLWLDETDAVVPAPDPLLINNSNCNTVQKGVGFYNTSDFKCPISITGVEILSGSCTLDKVYIIGNKLN